MGKQSTFREDYRKAFRLLNLVRTMDASILPQSILQAMLEACHLMCALFFTARLIDRPHGRKFSGCRLVCPVAVGLSLF